MDGQHNEVAKTRSETPCRFTTLDGGFIMLPRGRIYFFVAAVLVCSLIAGCGATPTLVPPTAVPAQPTTAPAAPTTAPAAPTAVPAAPTAVPAAPTVAPTKPAAAPTAPAVGDRAKTFIAAVAGDLEGWDPATATYFTAGDITSSVYDRLLELEVVKGTDGRLRADIGSFKGMLAEKYSVSTDGLTWTFNLRKDVKFHSGNDLTSADVKYSFDRGLKMNKGQLMSVLQFAGIMTTTQMSTPDPYIFVVKLDKPNPELLPILSLSSNVHVLDSKIVMANDTNDDPFAEKWMRNHVAGSGPFKLESYEPGNQITFVANKTYWKGAPALDRAIFRTVPSTQDRIMLISSGAVDMAYDLTALDLTTTLKGVKGVNVMSFPAPSTTVMFFNNTKAPFNNLKVRQALCYMMPYPALIDKVLYGLGKPAAGPIADGVLYSKVVNQCTYDAVKAKALLAEAGLANGFEFTLTVRIGRPEEEASVVIIQSELAKYNIKVNIEKVQTTAWAERRTAKTIDAGMDGYTPYAPDPSYVLEFWYKTGAVLNTWVYSNARVDEIAKLSLLELDATKRKALLEEAQDIIGKDQPVIWLFHPYWNAVLRDNVQGYSFFPDRFTRLGSLSKN
jgi:peptide/nickel transport system substrate-binding protein